MRQNIEALWQSCAGCTAYVVGSGATASMLPMHQIGHGDFDVFIFINQTWRDFPEWRGGSGNFVLTHHYEFVQAMIDNPFCPHVVTSDHNCGNPIYGSAGVSHESLFRGDYYTYHHGLNQRDTIDLTPLLTDAQDTLVMSDSTAAEGIHFAYHLGASAILCIGLDGAPLDGQINYPGYNRGFATRQQDLDRSWPLQMQVIHAVRAKGVFVGSVMPFVGLDLEGHHASPLLTRS